MISAVYDDVYDAVGDDFTEDEVVEAIRECNYDTKKAVSYLLYGTIPDSKPTTNKKSSNKPSTSTKPQSTPTKPTGGHTKATDTKEPTNKPAATQHKNKSDDNNNSSKGAPSALATDLCAPVVVSQPILKLVDASSFKPGMFLFLLFGASSVPN